MSIKIELEFEEEAFRDLLQSKDNPNRDLAALLAGLVANCPLYKERLANYIKGRFIDSIQDGEASSIS